MKAPSPLTTTNFVVITKWTDGTTRRSPHSQDYIARAVRDAMRGNPDVVSAEVVDVRKR